MILYSYIKHDTKILQIKHFSTLGYAGFTQYNRSLFLKFTSHKLLLDWIGHHGKFIYLILYILLVL